MELKQETFDPERNIGLRSLIHLLEKGGTQTYLMEIVDDKVTFYDSRGGMIGVMPTKLAKLAEKAKEITGMTISKQLTPEETE